MEHVISFPGLGLTLHLNRIAFSVLGKGIYWYGIIICTGFILAALYVNHRVRDYGLTSDNLFDVLIIAVPVSIVFARIYYVLFQWQDYKDNPIEIIKTWHGGIAVYGSIIGAVLVIVLFGKVKKLSIPGMLDLAAFGLLIGQSIGRWGNFVNAEAHGGETSLPWRMVIDGGAGVHPTFFYESLWNALGFVLLHFHSRKQRFRGEIFLEYVAWYGFGRMLIEGLRTDSLYIPGTAIRVSQVLAGVSCIAAICLIVYFYKKHRIYAVPTDIHIESQDDTGEDNK
ncbi:MAG: prolipoprotein diacylglyceryl transferase [Intestinibacillus sp.]